MEHTPLSPSSSDEEDESGFAITVGRSRSNSEGEPTYSAVPGPQLSRPVSPVDISRLSITNESLRRPEGSPKASDLTVEEPSSASSGTLKVQSEARRVSWSPEPDEIQDYNPRESVSLVARSRSPSPSAADETGSGTLTVQSEARRVSWSPEPDEIQDYNPRESVSLVARSRSPSPSAADETGSVLKVKTHNVRHLSKIEQYFRKLAQESQRESRLMAQALGKAKSYESLHELPEDMPWEWEKKPGESSSKVKDKRLKAKSTELDLSSEGKKEGGFFKKLKDKVSRQSSSSTSPDLVAAMDRKKKGASTSDLEGIDSSKKHTTERPASISIIPPLNPVPLIIISKPASTSEEEDISVFGEDEVFLTKDEELIPKDEVLVPKDEVIVTKEELLLPVDHLMVSKELALQDPSIHKIVPESKETACITVEEKGLPVTTARKIKRSPPVSKYRITDEPLYRKKSASPTFCPEDASSQVSQIVAAPLEHTPPLSRSEKVTGEDFARDLPPVASTQVESPLELEQYSDFGETSAAGQISPVGSPRASKLSLIASKLSPKSRSASSPESRSASPESRSASPESRSASPESRSASPESRSASPTSEACRTSPRAAQKRHPTVAIATMVKVKDDD